MDSVVLGEREGNRQRKLLGRNWPTVPWLSFQILFSLCSLNYSSPVHCDCCGISKSNQPIKHRKSPHELRFQIPSAELAAGDGGGAGVHGGAPRRRPLRARPNAGTCAAIPASPPSFPPILPALESLGFRGEQKRFRGSPGASGAGLGLSPATCASGVGLLHWVMERGFRCSSDY